MKKEEIKILYEKEKKKKGFSVGKFADGLNIKRTTMYDWVKQKFETKQKLFGSLSDETKEFIEKSFNDGFNVPAIAKQIKNTNQVTVRNYLKHLGVYDNQGNKAVKDNPFSCLSEDAQYWLGYLVADGCITYNTEKSKKTYSVLLTQNNQAQAHLINYVNFLGGNVKVNKSNEKGRDKSYVSFGNKEIVEWLISIGITPTKSGNIELSIPMSSSLLRGIFDGDGCIAKDYSMKITNGSLFLLRQIMGFLDANNISYRLGNDKSKNLPNHNPCYDLHIHKGTKSNDYQNTKNFFNLLYSNSQVHNRLNYKYQRFLEKG